MILMIRNRHNMCARDMHMIACHHVDYDYLYPKYCDGHYWTQIHHIRVGPLFPVVLIRICNIHY